VPRPLDGLEGGHEAAIAPVAKITPTSRKPANSCTLR
jgi:hypothetical protein